MGNNAVEGIIKDYNGTTFWLSYPVNNIISWEKIPDWLDLSLGYSADGMIGGTSNPSEINGITLPEFQRQRQLFLSFDVDLSEIKTQNKSFRTLFRLINFIKIPCPALEWNGHGLKLLPLYF